jgi:hypothetical protein
MTLFEVNDVVAKIQERIDRSTRLIFGAIFNQDMDGRISVAVVATGVGSEKKEPIAVKTTTNKEKEADMFEKLVSNQTIKQTQDTSKPNNTKPKAQPIPSFMPEVPNASLRYERESYQYIDTDIEQEFGADGKYRDAENSAKPSYVDDRFEDIEMQIINAVGASDFTTQDQPAIDRSVLLKIAREREFNQVRYVPNMSEMEDQEFISPNDIRSGNTMQQHPRPEHISVPVKVEEFKVEDKKRSAGIFARMAGMIKDKKDDYAEEKKKVNDVLIEENNLNPQPFLNSGFFSVMETETKDV